MKLLEDFMHVHTFVLVYSFFVFLAGARWWNKRQSKTYNVLVIFGAILFALVVILRVMAEFSN